MFGGCKLSQIVILLDKEPTSQSRIRSTAPLAGEPLAKPVALWELPRPLLLGEVAMRSIDGEVYSFNIFKAPSAIPSAGGAFCSFFALQNRRFC